MPKDLFSPTKENDMRLFGSKDKEPPVKETLAKLGTDAPRVLVTPIAVPSSKASLPQIKERSMSDDIRDQMLAILAQVNELREHEAQLVDEKESHRDQAKKSEEEFIRCENEIKELREQEVSLKAKMAEINGQLFFREEEKEVIEKDNVHVPYDGEGQRDTGARQAWQERAQLLKKSK
jgi:hypothetical protein